MSPKKKTNKLDPNKMINFYDLKEVKKLKTKNINPEFKNHHIELFFNSLMIGATGSGKTNCLLNLIHKFKNTFNHIYIFTKKEEPLYTFLQQKIPPAQITVKYGYQEFLDFDKDKFYGQSLVIFDDMNAEPNQKAISEHFLRGRKMSKPAGGGCCSIYLAQSYYDIPKFIRNQCDLIFMIKVPSIKNLHGIMKEYSLGETKEQMQNIYNYCCVDNTFGDFLLLNLKANRDKVYRKNFNEYLNPDNFK